MRTYWKQQKNYGKAEALLERKWPEKYNALGHLQWIGRLYGGGLTMTLGLFRRHIYQGTWGSALFQSLYQPTPNSLWQLTLTPEWYLVILALAVLSLLGLLWTPLLLALPLLVLALGTLIVQAGLSATHASFINAPRTRIAKLKLYGLTALLHMFQPLARLYGRLLHGLVPWRRHSIPGYACPYLHTITLWSEKWQDPITRLHSIEADLRAHRTKVRRGGDYDRWDLEVRDGLFGRTRMLMAIEEHGGGKQLVRFRSWPVWSFGGLMLLLLFALLSAGAALDGAWAAFVILGGVALLLALSIFEGCANTLMILLSVLKQPKQEEYPLSGGSPDLIEIVKMRRLDEYQSLARSEHS